MRTKKVKNIFALGRKLKAVPSEAHWGKMLHSALKLKGVSVAKLAIATERAETSIRSLFKSSSTETGIIWEMGKLLNVDFFEQLSRAFAPEKWAAWEAEKTADKAENAELRAKVADLEKEVQVLRSLLK